MALVHKITLLITSFLICMLSSLSVIADDSLEKAESSLINIESSLINAKGSLSQAEGSLSQAKGSILDFIPIIMAGTNKLPKAINFTVAYPVLVHSSEYIIDLNDWDIPINRTNAIKTTDNLQAVIDYAAEQGFTKVVIPNGVYLVGKYGNEIYQSGIDLHSDTEYVLSSNTIIEMVANNKWNYCVLRIQGQTNVIVRGGTIKGDRSAHTYLSLRHI